MEEREREIPQLTRGVEIHSDPVNWFREALAERKQFEKGLLKLTTSVGNL